MLSGSFNILTSNSLENQLGSILCEDDRFLLFKSRLNFLELVLVRTFFQAIFIQVVTIKFIFSFLHNAITCVCSLNCPIYRFSEGTIFKSLIESTSCTYLGTAKPTLRYQLNVYHHKLLIYF